MISKDFKDKYFSLQKKELDDFIGISSSQNFSEIKIIESLSNTPKNKKKFVGLPDYIVYPGDMHRLPPGIPDNASLGTRVLRTIQHCPTLPSEICNKIYRQISKTLGQPNNNTFINSLKSCASLAVGGSSTSGVPACSSWGGLDDAIKEFRQRW